MVAFPVMMVAFSAKGRYDHRYRLRPYYRATYDPDAAATLRSSQNQSIGAMLPLEMKKFQHPSAGSTELAAAG
jgi:hypothetical protein